MISATEFIKSKLEALVLLFPTAQCKYEFDNFDNTHTIEIEPSELLDNDVFIGLCDKINEEFIEQFPYDGLYFIDKDDLFSIKNELFTIKGFIIENEYNLTIDLPEIIRNTSINEAEISIINNNEVDNEIVIYNFKKNSSKLEELIINQSYIQVFDASSKDYAWAIAA